MRIIAGAYRGRRLLGPAGLATRPTSDRLRETLFNILMPRIEGVRFLDLCAGTGAVGLEALSRGAAHATFVEESRKMCALIRQNAALLGVSEQDNTVICREALSFLRTGPHAAAWEIIYFDPPYTMTYEPLLATLDAPQVLTDKGLIITEHHHKKVLPEIVGSLRRWRYLKQGDTGLSFYERA